MPPKKKEAKEDLSPLYLGRFGTSLKIGIVGVPNVGKSTFFNVLCKQVIYSVDIVCTEMKLTRKYQDGCLIEIKFSLIVIF